MKYRDLIKLLNNNGYTLKRVGKHQIFSNGIKHIAIPHTKEVNRMLTKRILKECGITVEF